ncbi:MAG: Gfo/Idh/MocA family oxidoreductase [Deltaproteobacteria bacterium]|nr:Gfo/Idh/MocA family oxidoreductase [Deltaproteobacteria bacterium]
MVDMKKSVKLGLIGCGQIAQAVHLPNLTRLSEVELVALAETDESRLEQAGRQVPHAQKFTDYSQLLSMPEIDAVIVCVPNALHAGVAIAAMEKGKHLYLEKPMATGVEDARRMLDVWQQTGVVGMMGFNYRFNQLYQTTQRVVQSGRIGEIVGARSIFSTADQESPQWKKSRESGGGVLLDLAPHDIDLVRFILGQEIAEVSASTRSLRSDADIATVQVRMEDGSYVQLFFSWGAVEESGLEIYGTAGKVSLNRYESLSPIVTGTKAGGQLKQVWRGLTSVAGLPYFVERLRAPMNEPSFARALEHFVDAVRGEHRASPDLFDGYRSQTVIQAAEESALTRNTIIPDSL